MPIANLREHLATFEVNWEHRTQDGDEQIHRSLGFESLDDLPTSQFTMWFHATRAIPGADFPDGLLPTMQALDRLWPILAPLALRWISQERWEEYRLSWGTGDRPFVEQFNRKGLVDTWEGPFAFLVRGCAVGGRDAGHKDFTKVGSEALEDICGDFEEVFGKPLGEEYVKATRRCLVVFTAPWCEPRYVRAALLYAYCSMRGLDPGFRGNDNFVGNGKQGVPREWIQKIELL